MGEYRLAAEGRAIMSTHPLRVFLAPSLNCYFLSHTWAVAQTLRIRLKYHHKKEYKGNQSKKLPDEVIQDVVGVLLVLAYIWNVGVGIFFVKY